MYTTMITHKSETKLLRPIEFTYFLYHSVNVFGFTYVYRSFTPNPQDYCRRFFHYLRTVFIHIDTGYSGRDSWFISLRFLLPRVEPLRIPIPLGITDIGFQSSSTQSLSLTYPLHKCHYSSSSYTLLLLFLVTTTVMGSVPTM